MLWTFLASDSTSAAQTDTSMTWPNDQTLTFDAAGRPILPFDMKIMWAYALGLTVTRMRLQMPYYLTIGRPAIRPIEQAANPSSRPQLAEYWRNPLTIKAVMPVVVQRTNTTGVAERDVCVLTVGDGNTNNQQGDMYCVRGTLPGTAVANNWTAMGAMTFDDNITPGTYQIAGFVCNGAGGVAARLIFPGAPAPSWPPQVRPGIISTTGAGNQDTRYFRWGYLGVFGQFVTPAPPQVEVFWTAATATPEFYLDITQLTSGLRLA